MQVRQLLLLQSLAGGTGSGAGTRITEAVRDCFPSAYILNGVVWPSSSGEVVSPGRSHRSRTDLSECSHCQDPHVHAERAEPATQAAT